LSVGPHSITAAYSGNSSNSASTSAVLNEVVSPATSTTTVGSSINPVTVGQSVIFTATITGFSPTGTVQFLDGTTSLGSGAIGAGGMTTLTLTTLSVGTHPITAAYGGNGSNSPSTSAVLNEVVLPAAAPPVVTPPARISIPATQAGGATGNASPTLAAFLAGGTATDSGAPPVQLAPQVGGVAVDDTTLFPVGTTTVTFRFEDANGNIGSATSTVTVAVGVPRITGSSGGVGTDPSSGAIYVNVVLTNTGTGNAQNLVINSLVFRTLSGTGTVTYNSRLSPAVPITIGNLAVGAAMTTRVYLNVPVTATRISLTESGPVQDVLGTNYNYSTAESVIP
jgi:hypothetical protein